MRLRQFMRRVSPWMTDHDIKLTAGKTEIVLLTKRYVPACAQHFTNAGRGRNCEDESRSSCTRGNNSNRSTGTGAETGFQEEAQNRESTS